MNLASRALVGIAVVIGAIAAIGGSCRNFEVPRDKDLGQVAACQSVKLHLQFNDDSATCLLQEGISPAHLLPEEVFGANGRDLREVLSAFSAPVGRKGNGTKWYILAEGRPHLETACLPVGAVGGDWCSWRLASRSLRPDLTYPAPMAELLGALRAAGMDDGRILVDTPVKTGDIASEFIHMYMVRSQIDEVIWHDVPVMEGWQPSWSDATAH